MVVLGERGVPGLRLSCQNSLAEVIHSLLLGDLLYHKRSRKVSLRRGDRGGGRVYIGFFGAFEVGGVEIVVLLPERRWSLESGGFIVAPRFVARSGARPSPSTGWMFGCREVVLDLVFAAHGAEVVREPVRYVLNGRARVEGRNVVVYLDGRARVVGDPRRHEARQGVGNLVYTSGRY